MHKWELPSCYPGFSSHYVGNLMHERIQQQSRQNDFLPVISLQQCKQEHKVQCLIAITHVYAYMLVYKYRLRNVRQDGFTFMMGNVTHSERITM